jgi:hypothetical protein
MATPKAKVDIDKNDTEAGSEQAIVAELSPEDQAKAIVAAKYAEYEKIGVRRYKSATGSNLIHPFTNKVFNSENEVKHEMDSWIECQLEAGKLIVEE